MSHESIANEFDRWAEKGEADSLEKHHGGVVLQVLERIEVGPGQRILDLGCGTGWATRLLGQAAPGSQAIGVDVSPKMIARAEELHELTIRARYEVGAFEALDFKDAFFDRVFSMEALYYAVELDRALAEAHRVLKSGGAIDVIVDFYRERPATAHWQEAVGLKMHYLGEAEWRDRFLAAGFTDVATERVVDSRGPGDEENFEPSEWYPDWETRLAEHAAGSLWIRGRHA